VPGTRVPRGRGSGRRSRRCGVSAGFCGGDVAGGGASEAPRAATANAVPSAALHMVDFSDSYGPRTARIERTSSPRSASSANELGA
jgi:hypothetical protein